MPEVDGLGLAVQLYTLRERLELDLGGTLEALAAVGVREVELAGLYGRDAASFRRMLEHSGIRACSAHVPLERFESEPEAVLDEARTLGTETLVVPSVPAPEGAAAADELVARLEAAGARAATAGLGFAYHNHDFEFGPLDGGADLWERITMSTIGLEPDVGWLQVAGRDPASTLSGLAGRCPLVHAKDVRRDANGGWADVPVGDGELDWPAIAGAAATAGASRLVIELDNPSPDPIDDVQRSLATLRDVLGL